MKSLEVFFSHDGWGGPQFKGGGIEFDTPQGVSALLGVIEYLRDWGLENYQAYQNRGRGREPRKGELLNPERRLSSLPLIEVSHPETSFSLTVQLPLENRGEEATLHLNYPDSASVKRARIEVGRDQLIVMPLGKGERLDESSAEALKEELFAFLNSRGLDIRLRKKSEFSGEWKTISKLSGIKAMAFQQKSLLELASPRACTFIKDLRGWSRDLGRMMGLEIGLSEQRRGIRLSIGGQNLRGRIVKMPEDEELMAIDDAKGNEEVIISRRGREFNEVSCHLSGRDLVFNLDEDRISLRINFPGVSLEAFPLKKHLQVILADDSKRKEFQVSWPEEDLTVWSRSGTEGDFQEYRSDSSGSGHQEDFGDFSVGFKKEQGMIVFRCWPSKTTGWGFDLRLPKEVFGRPSELLRLVFLDFETIRQMMREVSLASPRTSLW